MNKKDPVQKTSPSRKKKIGFEEIARECGVSTMTVSRALRPRSSVSAATRKKIIKMAEELGYQINARQGRPRKEEIASRPVVDVIISTAISLSGMFYSKLVVEIEQSLNAQGHDCAIRCCDAEYAEFVSLCNSLRLSRAKQFIIVGYFPAEQLEALLSAVPRAVLVDHTGDPRIEESCETVTIDYAEAARKAIRHLLKIKRQRIVFLRGPRDHYFTRDTERGYREVLSVHNIDVDASLLLDVNFSAHSANEAITNAIERGLKFDAVFTNDEMALGVLRALFNAGKKVPEDVAVVGCDNLPMGEQTIPSLTTISVDIKKMADLAVAKVLAEKGNSSLQGVQLIPVLVIRESTMTEK